MLNFLVALRAMFVRFAHDVCSLRSQYLFASLTIFAFGDVCASCVIRLCCHCEEQGDEAISRKGLPMVVGVQGAVPFQSLHLQPGWQHPGGDCRAAQYAARNDSTFSALRSSPSASFTPHSAFRNPHSYHHPTFSRITPVSSSAISRCWARSGWRGCRS